MDNQTTREIAEQLAHDTARRAIARLTFADALNHLAAALPSDRRADWDTLRDDATRIAELARTAVITVTIPES
jgi:hypothetical protein